MCVYTDTLEIKKNIVEKENIKWNDTDDGKTIAINTPCHKMVILIMHCLAMLEMKRDWVYRTACALYPIDVMIVKSLNMDVSKHATRINIKWKMENVARH